MPSSFTPGIGGTTGSAPVARTSFVVIQPGLPPGSRDFQLLALPVDLQRFGPVQHMELLDLLEESNIADDADRRWP